MNITFNSKVFGKVLANVYKAIPKKTATPILQMYFLEVTGDTLKVIGSNGEITIVENMSVVNNGPDGKAVVGANLMSYLKSLPDCDVTLETSEKSCTVSFKHGNSTLPCYNPEDYPEVNDNIEGLTSIEVSGKDLLQGFIHTIPFCSTEELRPVMGGVLLDIKDNQANLVSTNTHILSIYPISFNSIEGKPRSIIIPRSGAEIVKGYLGSTNVAIYADEQNCMFKIGESLVICRLIIGKFPNYMAVIPQDNPNKLSATKTEFLDTFNRVSTCCNKMSGLMKLSLGFMECSVEGQDLGFNVAAKENPEGFKFDGQDIAIGFKDENLIRAIGVINADEIEILISDPKYAAVIAATDSSKDASQIVVMPIMIK